MIKEATRQIARQPRNADLYLRRGELRRRHREYKSALADFAQALALKPALEVTHYYRGRTFYDQRLDAKAMTALDRFLGVEPDHPGARLLRARILIRGKDWLAGVREYDRALPGLKRRIPGHFIERARALAAAGPEHLVRAVRGLERGITELGPAITLMLCAVDLETKLGRYDDALTRLRALTEKSRRKERWLFRQGRVLAKAGRIPAARRAYRSALDGISILPLRLRRLKATRTLAAEIRKAITEL